MKSMLLNSIWSPASSDCQCPVNGDLCVYCLRNRNGPAGTQRCFNVAFRLILGRDVEQPNFKVDTTLLFQCLENNPFSTLFQRQISTLKQRHISTLKQRHISTLKQRHISTLIRFNKIECLFNIKVRRCFNLYLPAGVLQFVLLFYSFILINNCIMKN